VHNDRYTPLFFREKKIDVIIIGAGPAGGQCARDLAAAGKDVLLVEKALSFSANNFSTAGAPTEILNTFALPEEVVATRWNDIMFRSTTIEKRWSSPEPQGVVIDFEKLRTFLAQDTLRHSGSVALGWTYQQHHYQEERFHVLLKNKNDQQLHKFQARVLVDATGSERRVLARDNYKRSDTEKVFAATGIELLVKTSPEAYEKYKKTISFFFGNHWMPRGYGWIFPMQENILKIGIGRYFSQKHHDTSSISFRENLDNLIENTIGAKDLTILDRHGKTLYYTYGQKDVVYGEGIIALGDAISLANPLAFEGIRHAMFSGSSAARHVSQYLEGKIGSFKGYAEEMRCYCKVKWPLSEFIMKKLYTQHDDEKIDLIIQAFEKLSYDEMLKVCFHYNPFLLFKISVKVVYKLLVHFFKKIIR
jgi:digeranylgeranylglycerophospholipid reductase